MAERQQHREIPAQHRAQEHLANERTFLAWVRTTIALISLGFVLARVGPWLDHGGRGAAQASAKTPVLGFGLVVLGALLTLLAAWRYDAVNREIESGLVKTDRALVWFVALGVALLAIALLVYMLAAHPAESQI
jgi:putative membrane protein